MVLLLLLEHEVLDERTLQEELIPGKITPRGAKMITHFAFPGLIQSRPPQVPAPCLAR